MWAWIATDIYFMTQIEKGVTDKNNTPIYTSPYLSHFNMSLGFLEENLWTGIQCNSLYIHLCVLPRWEIL